MQQDHDMPRIVFAASLGTVFEYCDFMLYGSLAAFFSSLFFPAENPTASLLASLATFGAGFAMRPVGALLFGRLGDTVGRKRSFLITIVIMGLATTLGGCCRASPSAGSSAARHCTSPNTVRPRAAAGSPPGSRSRARWD